MENLRDLLKEFYPFARKRFGFDKNAKIIFLEDEDNASNPLGKTAFYNPGDYTVSVYVTGRHPKDILRSVSHELVHHTQNCRGEFTNTENMGGQGYAQKDEHLREMEREAYEQGNLCFRDWEDMRKNNLDTNYVNEDGNMSNKDLRNHRLNSHIMNKWGFSSKKEETEEQVEEQMGYGELDFDLDNYDDEDEEMKALKNDPEFAELFKDLERDADEEGAYADAKMDAGDDDEYKDEEELDELPFQEGAKVHVIATENCGEEATVLEMLDDSTAKIQIGDEELVIRQDYLEKIKLDEAKGKYDDGDEEAEKCDYVDCDDEDEDKKVEEGVIDWIKDKLGMGLKGKRDIERHHTPGLAAVQYGREALSPANKIIKRFILPEIARQEKYQERYRKDPTSYGDKTKTGNQSWLKDLYEYRDNYMKFRALILNLSADLDGENVVDIKPWLKFREEEQVEEQMAYLKEKYLIPLKETFRGIEMPDARLEEIPPPDLRGEADGSPIPLIKGKTLNQLQLAINQLELDIKILNYMKKKTPWGSFDPSTDNRRKGIKSDIAAGSGMYGSTLNVGMNEESAKLRPDVEKAGDQMLKYKPLLDRLSKIDNKQEAAQMIALVAKKIGISDFKQLNSMSSLLKQAMVGVKEEMEDETVEEISSCAGGAVEGAPMASKKDDDEDELEEAGRPHSMRYGRKMSDLDADAKTRETDFLKKKEDEKEDDDENEKIEESFSIKSAASNRNKLLSEQVMKAWFNK